MLAAVAKAAQYAQVEARLVERNSQRSIARAMGVARLTLAKRLKKAAAAPPPLPGYARKRRSARRGKPGNPASAVALWVTKSARAGCGLR